MRLSSPLNRRAFLHRSAALAATSLVASRLSPLLHAGEPGAEFRSTWDRAPDRTWLGAEYWSNPLQDWRVAGGRIECLNAAADRNVHLLPRQLAHRAGTAELRVRLGRVDGGPLAGQGSAGFRIGILGTLKDYPELHDYRNNLWSAPTAGFDAGVSGDGRLFLHRLGAPNGVKLDLNRESVELRLAVTPRAAPTPRRWAPSIPPMAGNWRRSRSTASTVMRSSATSPSSAISREPVATPSTPRVKARPRRRPPPPPDLASDSDSSGSATGA